MAHGINDHVPVGAAVAVPSEFLNKVLDLLHPMHAAAVTSLEDRALPVEMPVAPAPALSDAQFDELKELLRPGYELAKLLLEDRQSAQLAEAPDQKFDPVKWVSHGDGAERSESEQSLG